MLKRCIIFSFNSNYLQVRYHGRKFNKSMNPGIQRQVNHLEEVDDLAEDPEGFGGIESDFFDVHKTHRQYEREVIAHNEKIKHKIVVNKYFKSDNLNFLTWAEKERIRYLHEQEPEEWTIEMLADNFPATAETICKILKSKWLPTKSKRIIKHDETVKKSWELLKNNKIDSLDEEFVAHLRKFANRDIDQLTNLCKHIDLKRISIPKPKSQEFLNILTSCKKYQNNNEESVHSIDEQMTSGKNSLRLTDGKQSSVIHTDDVQQHKHSKKHITFKQLNLPIVNEVNDYQNVDEDVSDHVDVEKNEHIRNTDNHLYNKIGEQSTSIDNQLKIFNDNHVGNAEIELKTSDLLKDRIKIPKKLFKKGATYKLRDCYYDADGTFLYRVPGMT